MAEKIIRSDAILVGSQSQTHDVQAIISRTTGMTFERTSDDDDTIHAMDGHGNYLYPTMMTLGSDPIRGHHIVANGEHIAHLLAQLASGISFEQSLADLQLADRHYDRTPIAGLLSIKVPLVVGKFISLPRSRDGKYLNRNLDGVPISTPGLGFVYEPGEPLKKVPLEGTTPGEIAKHLWEAVVLDEENAALVVKTVERRTGEVLISTIDSQNSKARPL